MRKLDKLILHSFLGPFFLTYAVVLFILLIQTMLQNIDKFMGKDLGLAVFAELLFYFSVSLTPQALPLAMLLSSLICFGNLGEYYELTAIKSAGISLLRVLFPIFLFALLVSVFAFVFSNTMVPKANLNVFSLLWDVKQKKPSMDIKEGVFYNGLPNISIKANKKLPSKEGEILLDVMLYNHQDQEGNNEVILADSAKMYTIRNERYLVVELFRGDRYEAMEPNARESQKDRFMREEFDQSKILVSMSSFDLSRTKKEYFASSKYMMNTTQLEQVADSVYKDYLLLEKNTFSNASQFYSSHLQSKPLKTEVFTGSWVDSLDKQKLLADKKQDILMAAANQARNIKNFTQSHLQQMENKLKESRTFRVEKHKKYTQSLACLIMFLIGAPLGAIIKKGGLGVPVLVSITFFIIFYVVSLLGEKWAKEGFITISSGAWAANCILLLCGLIFLRQAKNDSRLFEAEEYKLFLGSLLAKWMR